MLLCRSQGDQPGVRRAPGRRSNSEPHAPRPPYERLSFGEDSAGQNREICSLGGVSNRPVSEISRCRLHGRRRRSPDRRHSRSDGSRRLRRDRVAGASGRARWTCRRQLRRRCIREASRGQGVAGESAKKSRRWKAISATAVLDSRPRSRRRRSNRPGGSAIHEGRARHSGRASPRDSPGAGTRAVPRGLAASMRSSSTACSSRLSTSFSVETRWCASTSRQTWPWKAGFRRERGGSPDRR